MLNRFKRWLYTAPANEEGGRPDLDNLINPFAWLIEDPACPWARVYQTNLWEKIADAFRVLIGRHFNPIQFRGRETCHNGILDLLILPILLRWLGNFLIPKVVDTKWLCSTAHTNSIIDHILFVIKLISWPVIALVAAVWFYGQGARFLLGAIFTFICLPIIIGFQIWSSLKVKSFCQQVDQMPVSSQTALLWAPCHQVSLDADFLAKLERRAIREGNLPVVIRWTNPGSSETHFYVFGLTRQGKWQITGELENPTKGKKFFDGLIALEEKGPQIIESKDFARINCIDFVYAIFEAGLHYVPEQSLAQELNSSRSVEVAMPSSAVILKKISIKSVTPLLKSNEIIMPTQNLSINLVIESFSPENPSCSYSWYWKMLIRTDLDLPEVALGMAALQELGKAPQQDQTTMQTHCLFFQNEFDTALKKIFPPELVEIIQGYNNSKVPVFRIASEC